MTSSATATTNLLLRALDAWWKRYGRAWWPTRKIIQRHGWEEDDVLSFLRVKLLERQQPGSGSRYDPDRASVEAYVSVLAGGCLRNQAAKLSGPSPDAWHDAATLEPVAGQWDMARGKAAHLPTVEEVRASMGLRTPAPVRASLGIPLRAVVSVPYYDPHPVRPAPTPAPRSGRRSSAWSTAVQLTLPFGGPVGARP